VLVAKAAADVADVPAAVAVVGDLRAPESRSGRLVEGARDQLADGVSEGPVLEDALDI
jgi:hypothetical protein